MNIYILIQVFIVSFAISAYGLYFHIGETERKCFIEEIPDSTMVTGKIYNFLAICFLIKLTTLL